MNGRSAWMLGCTVLILALAMGIAQAGGGTDPSERPSSQEVRDAIKAAAEARAATDPMFRRYLNEVEKRQEVGPTEKSLREGQKHQKPRGTVQAQPVQTGTSRTARLAPVPMVYPWPHNPIPDPAIGFNPLVNYDLPNYSQSPNIRKFMDSLPGVGQANANNLGQYIPLAVPDTTTYPGSEFYDITIKQYQQQMHSDLPPTTLRGYAQVAGAGPGQSSDPTVGGVNQYLGPAILARVYDPTRPAGVLDAKGLNGMPVRLLFRNELPLSSDPNGALPLPLDRTVMGAGMGPTMGQEYTDNRVSTPHLHGGRTPWISDGTPHQWITPAGDPTVYKKGVSIQNVPDMIGPGKSIPSPAAGDGMTTSFFTNQQSARLMFWHDHAYGITRLNVYDGVAAPYLLVDQVEEDLIDGTNLSGGNPAGTQILPNLGGVYRYGIPLVIQDKAYVNDAATPSLEAQAWFPGGKYAETFKTVDVDPLWYDYVRGPGGIAPGGGNLWMSHEYMPVQNVFDYVGGSVPDPGTGELFEWSAGNTTNGRWDYGPFLNPPMISSNLVLPSPTLTPEALADTMVVNGTAFPYIELPPDTIRFRILGAPNDRVLNLSLFEAEPLTIRVTNGGSGYAAGATVVIDPPPAVPGAVQATATCTVINGVVTDITVTDPGAKYALTPAAPPAVTIVDVPGGTGTGATAYATVATEVKMVDAAPNDAFPTWPRDGRDGGVPDPLTKGPDWNLIGNEGGFLAKAAVIPAQPVDYNYVRQVIPWLGVTSTSLMLVPAQRADVVVDFTPYQDGDVLILYNDAPAPMSGFWPLYDCYSDNPDLRMMGGPTPTPPGFGPNTRTVMQIRIKGTKASPFVFDQAALMTAIPKAFAVANDKPIVPQLAYNDAFPGFATRDVYIHNGEESLRLDGQPNSVGLIRTILPGAGYTTPPTVNIIGGNGTGATAVAGLRPVGGITLLTAGSGYTSAPTVTISAPGAGGVQATASAIVSGGQVQAIVISEPGSNYSTTVPATVTINGGGGTGATAQAFVATAGTVGSIRITAGGSGYTVQPRIYLTGGGGFGAMAIAMVTGATVMTDKMITEGFDPEFGRIFTQLGSIPNPLTPTVGAGMVLGMARYIDPPTEFVNDGENTLWRIGHIGVDSHSLHFHLFDVQVINRVDWTNVIKPPYPDEIGWRESIRTNPMEDIIVAFRPRTVPLPFVIPQSNRLLDPTTPAGSTTNFMPIPPPPGIAAVPQITNVMTNFGFEYVWHCHMLSHEENDFMRPLCLLQTPPAAPTGFGVVNSPNPANGMPQALASWVNPTSGVTGITLQRATNTNFTSGLVTWNLPAIATSYLDSSVAPNTWYVYRVRATSSAGNSPWSRTRSITTWGQVPAAPTGLNATNIASTTLTLNWTNGVGGTVPTSIRIQRALDAGFTQSLATVTIFDGTATSYNVTGQTALTTYYYRVADRNSSGTSAWSNVISVTTP